MGWKSRKVRVCPGGLGALPFDLDKGAFRESPQRLFPKGRWELFPEWFR